MGNRVADRLKDDSFEKRGVTYGCLHVLHYGATTDSTTHTTAVALDTLTNEKGAWKMFRSNDRNIEDEHLLVYTRDERRRTTVTVRRATGGT